MDEKTIIWYRCDKCGKGFNNENEISPAFVNRTELGTTTRYYFNGGTAWFGPHAPAGKAECWECQDI